MPTPAEWTTLITGAAQPATVEAETFHRELPGLTYPVLLTCTDGRDYVVKGKAAPGRSLISESLIAAAGATIAAPVPPAVWVDVPEILIAWAREMAPFQHASTCHGSLWIADCTDASPLMYAEQPVNQGRLAALRLLYTWVGAADHQLIYKKVAPNEVYSVDHNNFFPGGALWTLNDLEASPPPVWDAFFDRAMLPADVRAGARARLEAVTLEQIARIVAAPHESWGYTLQERIATADYLLRRQTEVLSLADQ